MKESEMNGRNMNKLFGAIASLKTPAECKKFFRDLCTLSELKAMNERFRVAKEVSRGTPYRNIAKKTGSSTATITRVAHWLHHGMGGYQFMLKRVKP